MAKFALTTLSRTHLIIALLLALAPTAAAAAEPTIDEPPPAAPSTDEPAPTEPPSAEPPPVLPRPATLPAPSAATRPLVPLPPAGSGPRAERRALAYRDGSAPLSLAPTPVMALSGPRVGVSYLQGRSWEAFREHIGPGAYPVAMVLGWQFEYAWMASNDGTGGLIEVVPTVSGFNQGTLIPGLNLLIGLRSSGGLEAALGSQLTIGGADVVNVGALVALGATLRTESLNFPVHIVWVTGERSNRVALMFGFSRATP